MTPQAHAHLSKVCRFGLDEHILRQGDDSADAFYVLRAGEAAVLQFSPPADATPTTDGTLAFTVPSSDASADDGDMDPPLPGLKHVIAPETAPAQQIGYLYVGDFFGEQALLHPQSPPAASVVSRARVTEVLRIDSAAFQLLVGPLSEILDRTDVAAELTNPVPLFAQLTADCRARLRERLRPETFADGECIFEHNGPGDKLHIVTAGRVSIRVPDTAEPTGWAEVERLGVGEVFGERALVKGQPRMASAVAVGDVRTCSLAAADFDALQMQERAR